jgi:hypothetical protein
MNVGQVYAIKIPTNPYQAMNPLPFSMYGSPCMKNKCMKIKKKIQGEKSFDHDYLVDILNMMDGTMDMPNVKIKSDMFQPRLISAFKIKSKSKKDKKKKDKTKKKGEKTMKFPLKSLTETLSLPSLLSEDFLSNGFSEDLFKPRIKTEKRKKKKKGESAKKSDKNSRSRRSSLKKKIATIRKGKRKGKR